MELSDAAASFDTQPVLDAYSSVLLFHGQPDLFDASTQDSTAGWRRTLSAASIIVPARGCIKLDTDIYIVGRAVSDFFEGTVIRENALLHPADDLVEAGTPDKFLGTAGSVQFYAGLSWLKARKEESRTSEATTIYDVFCSPTETSGVGTILKDGGGNYLRVFSADTRSGEISVLTTHDLGADVLRSVSYVSAGAYDAVSDSSSTSAPVSINAFVEFYGTNYLYENNASTKFERSDKVITVRVLDVPNPGPGDVITDGTQGLRVLERIQDGDCWALHVRPE